MATITISSLPTEINVSIAEYCPNNDLINLCLTSKRMNETCLPVLYRHVNLLRFDRYNKGIHLKNECYRMWDALKQQQQFVRTLLSHPEFGQHVRFFKGMLCLPRFDDNRYWLTLGKDAISDEELWHAMQSLTHVQDVDVGTRNGFAYRIKAPTKQFPTALFQSATSVRLAGHMQYGLAKSILNSINPATLRDLCLDMVQDRHIRRFQLKYVPGNRVGDEQIPVLGAMSGLLMPLTGRCTALRNLVLRREGLRQFEGAYKLYETAEEASYVEWALFIRSVMGTLEKFTFEYSGKSLDDMELMDPGYDSSFRTMDERFRRLILPTIISGSWPCLAFIKLRGIRRSNAHLGHTTLRSELRAALGRNVKIVVKEHPRFLHWEPYG